MTTVYLDPQVECSQNSLKAFQIFSNHPLPSGRGLTIMNDKTVATDKRFTRDRKKNRMLIIVAFFLLREMKQGAQTAKPTPLCLYATCCIWQGAKLLGLKYLCS